MERQEISLFQLEILVKSIDVLPDYMKSIFLKFFKRDLQGKTLEKKKFAIRAAYNVFNLLSVIGTKELFLNGKVVFTVDMGIIYKHFAEDFDQNNAMELFTCCEISRDLTNTYIMLNLSKILFKNNNLKFSTSSAVVIPVEILTINAKYNNTLISKLKELLI